VLKRLLVLLVLASVVSSCGTTSKDKELEIAIEKACETVINPVTGGVSVSGGAFTAFAELARLDARYLPLLISFSDWWQSQRRALDNPGPIKYPPFPDALIYFCRP